MKIYIVTQGEYSDYHIEAVFLDEKKAQMYCATRLHGEPCYIEEYDPHDSDIDAPDCNPVCCAVGYIWDDGRIELDYYIGVLSGLAWAELIDEKCRPIAEALNVVIAGLEKIREGDMDGV